MTFIYTCYLDHTATRSDTRTYNYYSTQQYYVQETPLGTLTPKPRERFHLNIIIITAAVIIAVSSCISIVVTGVCVKKSTLAWKKEISKTLTSSNKVNHEHYEKAEPVYATISETGDSVGEMQVEMTNNVAYKSVHFTKTSILTPTDIDVTRNEAYSLVITECR